MDLDADIVIIGGGMAGLTAGTVAAESGLRTILLRKGQSATSLSSGAIDIVGYMPGGNIPFSSPKEGLEAITACYPFHPYAILGWAEDKSQNMTEIIINRVRKPIEWLLGHLKQSNTQLAGKFDENIQAISVLGTTKPTCLIQEPMYPGSLEDIEDSVLFFVGFKGHPDFNAALTARTYLDTQAQFGNPPKKVAHCVLDIVPFGKPYNVSSIEIARHLDHKGTLENIISELKPQIENTGASYVAFPPILGLHKASKNKKALEEAIGATVFELLAFPPSIPGLRLQTALENMYTRNGGSLMAGFEAVSYSKKGDSIASIKARGPQRNMNISTKCAILASGKYIGGGIEGGDKGLRETVFDLMTVNIGLYKADKIKPSKQTNIVSLSPKGQPIFGSGLAVDRWFRPLGEDQMHSAENLFAAGSVLAGYIDSMEKSGLGVALTTGYAAGENAVKFLKEGI